MMKTVLKVIGNIFFVCLCVLAFVVSIVIGAALAPNFLTNQRYGYLKVNFTEEVGTTLKDQRYGDDPLHTYDLYLPADKTKENYSFMLFVHGGGFTGGDKGAIEAVRYGEYLASKGYVVASVNYRLATEVNDVGINEMYEDLMAAVDVIVEKTDQIGYHINEMATTGGSAGGCLAMLVAFKEPDRLPVPIRFVLEETGPASFEPELWDATTDAQKAEFVNSLTRKDFTASDVGSAEYQRAIDEISPAAMVNENTVPIILAYGPKDQLVNPKAKYPLLDALEANGVEHIYIEFPNSGHGLSADPDKTKAYYQAMEDYLERFFENN